MRSGQPLDDADRAPWLAAIAQWMDERRELGQPGVVSCSALKRAYRERIIGSRRDVRRPALRLRIADQLHASFVEDVRDARHERIGDVGVDDKRLGTVADAGALRLGVDDDLHCLVEIGRRVDVDVTVAVAVDDDGDGRVVTDAPDE